MSKIAVFRRAGEVIMVDLTRARYDRMRKKIAAWGNETKDINGKMVFITLTYKNVIDWEPNHIRDFIKKIRYKYKGSLIGYAWVAEVQKRGAVHYHILLKFNKSVFVPFPDRAGWWKHGMTNVSRTVKGVGYLISYTSKIHQKDFDKLPRGCRCFSVWFNDVAVMLKLRVVAWSEKVKILYAAGGAELVKKYKDHLRLLGDGCYFNGIINASSVSQNILFQGG